MEVVFLVALYDAQILQIFVQLLFKVRAMPAPADAVAICCFVKMKTVSALFKK